VLNSEFALVGRFGNDARDGRMETSGGGRDAELHGVRYALATILAGGRADERK
jgi:hypothetical protein